MTDRVESSVGVLQRVKTALFGTGSVASENTENDNRACKVSGHNYSGNWSLYGYFARTSGLNRSKFKVYKKETARCSKCGKAETRKKTIGHVRVTDDDELEVV